MPPENAAFQEGDLVESRYKIQGLIGVGPVGQLYKAFDQELDVAVALKAISPRLMQTPEERKAFSREIRLARKLSHPNLVHVHSDGTEHNWAFFTMQLLDGLTLRKIIDLRREKNERFKLKDVEPIFTQIAAALEAAHEVGPHGGVKPENIIVLPDLLKLTDFGLGLALPRIPFVAAERSTGAHVYLAPEFASGNEEVDGRIDVYSMGVILGEMLAGVLPDGGQIPDPRTKAPHLPAEITALYMRALNENPLCRPAKPTEFAKELSAIAAEFPEEEEDASPPPLPMAGQPDGAVAAAVPPPIPDGTVPPPLPKREKSGKAAPDMSKVKLSQPPRQAPSKLPVVPLILTIALATAGGLFGVRAYMRHQHPAAPQPAAPAQTAAPAGKTDAQAKAQPQAAPQPASETSKAPPAGQAQGGASPSSPASSNKAPEAGTQTAKAAGSSQDTKKADVPAAPAPSAPAKGKDASPASEQPGGNAPAQTAAADPQKQPDKDKAPEPNPQKQTKAVTPAPDDVSDLKTGSPAKAPPKPPAVRTPASGCPAARMKLIPSGTYEAGTSESDPMRGFGERAIEKIQVPAYCIDIYEFSNRKGLLPKGKISYQLAEAACEKEGKRLCTEDEWERACKGPRNYRFPYGNAFDASICNTQDIGGTNRSIRASGESSGCISGYGVIDLSGNLAEWTSSPYNARGTGKVIKGGAANRPDHASRCSARRNGPINKPETDTMVGFRCCADPVKK